MPAQTRITQDQTNFSSLQLHSTNPSRIYLMQGAAPVNTIDIEQGVATTYDVVIYQDAADGKLHALKKNGTVVQLEP